ncbi:hypothetical protein [Mesorhizobium sp. M7A.F.Ca.US.006.01.1.1]|uniref:hypothetical protein n=1 Tax=Mesorhizobium sp. M7A.F.Ca.US.006.01.1.1 TaxID=2496707 RepID=UPI0013E2AC78|nr:hypothetical protein [Mesorhizobium sp. M7A.F.Ca.US.006.01.1.1]
MPYPVEPHREPLFDRASSKQMVQFGVFDRASYDLANGFAGKFGRDEIISPAPGDNVLFDQHLHAPERDFFGVLHFVPPRAELPDGYIVPSWVSKHHRCHHGKPALPEQGRAGWIRLIGTRSRSIKQGEQRCCTDIELAWT